MVRRNAIVGAALLSLLVLMAGVAWPQENDDCMMCHSDPDLITETESGQERSLFVDIDSYTASIHGELDCILCHSDITDIPHESTLAPVACSDCHDTQEEMYAKSLHGQAISQDDPLAPQCWTCHGAHDILPRTNPNSRTNPINIPEMCGGCHSEDAPVARSRNIAQHEILQHYTQSIHGVGLLQKARGPETYWKSSGSGRGARPYRLQPVGGAGADDSRAS